MYPQGYPQPQQQYAPQPQPQYAPPVQHNAHTPPPPPPSAPAGVVPQLIDPTFGGGAWPAWRALQGRLVAIQCKRLGEADNMATPPVKVPTAWADLYVLDGPWPLYYGAKLDGTRPDTHLIQGPAMFRDVQIQHVNIYRAAADGLNRGGAVIGVIKRSEIGSQGSKPWNIEALEPGDPRRALAAQIFGEAAAGTRAWADPIEIAPQQPAPAVPQQYAPPPVPQPQQQYAPQQQAYPQQYTPQYAPTPQYTQPQQQYGPQPVPRPPQIPEATWLQIPDDQKPVVAAQLAAQAAAQQPPNPY